LEPQAVVFDIGNVLVGWVAEAFYDTRIGEARRRRLFDEVPLHAVNLEIDRGAPFRTSIEALAAAHPDWAAEIQWWHDDWAAMLQPEITHSSTLLRRLRGKGIPVFALTNFGAETLEIARAMYPVLKEFDRAYVSAELGLLKPDPAIYAHVEADCGLAPGALIFADDKPENVAAAIARGWKAHVFDGPEGWAARLVAEGLLNAEEARA